MSGWDEGQVYYNDNGRGPADESGGSLSAARIKYREFIRSYRDEERGTFIYRCVPSATHCTGAHHR